MADYFERVVTDGWENVSEDAYELSSENFLGYDGPSWHISNYTLTGGKQQGVELVEIDNGCMTVLVVPTRGMGVLEAFTDEVSLGWSSPVRQVVHPSFVEAGAAGGLGWLTGFNELICRCGLSYHGAPGEDVLPGVAGMQKRVTLPLHGTIANTPAMRVAVRVQLQEPYELSVVGEVPDTRMFGPSFSMLSTISTVPGSREFAVQDVITNLGAMPTEMELLYHCNYGPPLLGEGARLLAAASFVAPRDKRAQEDMATWDTYGPPEPGFAEQCYFLRMHADDGGQTMVALADPEEETAATIRYSVEELPAFTIWRNTAADCEGYVTGLEPGTDYPNPRLFERQKGRVIELAPEATYRTRLVFGLVDSEEEVAAVRQEIAALSEGKDCVVREAPDPDYCP
ncbi:MAG: hypothetical protein AMK73_02800 [Planctomycetes bacterium SM23_32]|nr:MAG: hypothetical protein AMK73_02800 [Planctomycetes bacterium SM23_32]